MVRVLFLFPLQSVLKSLKASTLRVRGKLDFDVIAVLGISIITTEMPLCADLHNGEILIILKTFHEQLR